MPEAKHRQSSFVKISNEIMHYAMEKDLKTGDRLPTEQNLAELFGVSRTSIREAITFLAAKDHVETKHGKGTFLLHNAKDMSLSNINEILDACSFADLMELRLMLETWGARLAAQRATREQIKAIEQAIGETEACEDDETAYFYSDLAFHASVARASNNQFIVTVIGILFKELERQSYRVKVLTWLTRESTISEMKKTVAAIKKKDSSAAGKSMERHIMEINELTAKNHLKL